MADQVCPTNPFFILPPELRYIVYSFVWAKTLPFAVKYELYLYIVSPTRLLKGTDDTRKAFISGIPTWLLASKAILEEGVAELQRTACWIVDIKLPTRQIQTLLVPWQARELRDENVLARIGWLPADQSHRTWTTNLDLGKVFPLIEDVYSWLDCRPARIQLRVLHLGLKIQSERAPLAQAGTMSIPIGNWIRDLVKAPLKRLVVDIELSKDLEKNTQASVLSWRREVLRSIEVAFAEVAGVFVEVGAQARVEERTRFIFEPQ